MTDATQVRDLQQTRQKAASEVQEAARQGGLLLLVAIGVIYYMGFR